MTDYPCTKTWNRFSKAASLVCEPLALCRAALAQQCFPNSNAALLSLRQAKLVHPLRSQEQDAVSAAVKRLEWKLLQLSAAADYTVFLHQGPRSTSVTFGSISWRKRWEIAVLAFVNSPKVLILLRYTHTLMYSLSPRNAPSFINPQFVEGFAE